MASRASLSEDEFRLLTWTRPQLTRMTIQPESLRQHCPLDNGRLQQHATSPTSIGNLEVLPLGIIHAVLSIIDLQSLTTFRAVSWHARALVDSLPTYAVIIHHTSDTLRALLSTRMAVHFTAQDIFEALCGQSCCCGQFGPFLDLFTARRRCLPCVINSEDLLSTKASLVTARFGLSAKKMCTLPSLLSLPGEYGEGKKRCSQRVFLVRACSINNAVQMNQHDKSAGSPLPTITQVRATPAFRKLLQQDSGGLNSYRFMPMIRFPSLDRKTRSLEWGVSCQGCRLGPRHEKRGYYDWNAVYSVTGYLGHFERCEVSQIGKEAIPRYTTAIRDGRGHTQRFLGFLNNLKF